MAITKSVSFRGITLPSAYIRVDRIMGGKRTGFQAEVGVYAEANVDLPLTTFGLSFNFDEGKDILPTAYDAMKSLPEFADATDC